MKPEENQKTTKDKTGEPVQPSQKAEMPKPKKKSAFQSMLKQIGLGLLFLIIGMLAILLALYLPITNKLKEAQVELNRLIPLETQYLDLQESYSKIQAQSLLYKVMSNTSLLRVALEDNDSSRANQYISYIEEDLNQMEINEFPEMPDNLLTQFNKVKSNITSDRLTAIEELQEFYNDLLLLSDNL